MSPKPLTREALLAKVKELRPKALEVPELEATVYLRPLSLAAMSRLQEIGKNPDSESSETAVAAILDCLCDETGARILTSEDRSFVLDMPSAAVQRIADAIISETTNKDAPKEAQGN